MRSIAGATALLLLSGAAALAAGSGDHSHAQTRPVGRPAAAAEADRSVSVRMVESGGAMGFEPASLRVEEGQTIRFEVTNTGTLDHELVLGTKQANRAHKAEMAEGQAEPHDDPNALRLAPGESGTLTWTFANEGTFQFACLIPGHMEAGMHGPITVE